VLQKIGLFDQGDDANNNLVVGDLEGRAGSVCQIADKPSAFL
jgi:hypothetical protein